ncbi:hypothetical protein RAAC3_TM7C00001G0923 [Candidatus Saccharibacteria bacterium RAAC3_TM7_1]|nr:hypothetical protein RAAC3_TM7C00001G0923 [Candidatus Saccharibacteria bacterium RAAC3_TM7_1]
MATKQKEWKDMSKGEKTMTVLILPIIIIIIIAVASAIFGGDKKTNESVAKTEISKTETAQPVPKFDTYLNRPMSEVASEFGPNLRSSEQYADTGRKRRLQAIL